MSRFEAGSKASEGSGNERLLHDIEAISKALNVDKKPSKSAYTRPNSLSNSSAKPHLPDSKSKSKNLREDPSQNDQKDKKSFWNWKPLKALSHIRNKRFNCCFSLLVHSIEDLPSNFNDLSLCVHWKRRDGDVVTRPSKVSHGISEFEEKLTHICSVYGSRNGPNHSAKYEAKHFLLYASVFGSADIDLGKHRVDLTRLLPLTLEELEDEKSSGTWTTSFKLSGDGKGATMHVSFGYSVIKDNPTASHNKNLPEVSNLKQSNLNRINSVTKLGQNDGRNSIRRAGSLLGNQNQRSRSSSRSMEDIKILHEVLPTSIAELSSTISDLYPKSDDEKLDIEVDYKPEVEVFTENIESVKSDSYFLSDYDKKNDIKIFEDDECSVTKHGAESPSKEQIQSENPIKVIDVSVVENVDFVKTDSDYKVILEDDATLNTVGEEYNKSINEQCSGVAFEAEANLLLQDEEHNDFSKDDDISRKESLMKDLESALNSFTDLGGDELSSPEEEDFTEVNFTHESGSSKEQLHSLDDASQSVANEFLDMLGIEHSPFGFSSESDPESPRERLLRQFEKDTLSNGFSLFDLNTDEIGHKAFGETSASSSTWGHFFDDVGFPSPPQEVSENFPRVDIQGLETKTRASILEDLETESLMQEWGLNEKAFQGSPPPQTGSGGFGSPIDLPPENNFQLPPLGEALGPFLQTKNGGFLRSMNPAIFRNAKSGGNLIMQVSNPVVVPAEMGSGILEILQGLASVGIEKLSMQANKLMPLEDITGKTMQQIAWEAESTTCVDVAERQDPPHIESEIEEDSYLAQKEVKGRSFTPKSSNIGSSPVRNKIDSEYVSLEDLAPLAMDKIEALSMEGLRVQSGMSNEDSLSSFSSQSIGGVAALNGKGASISGTMGLEGTAGLQLIDVKDNDDNLDDGLMGLSLTLDEWMKLDSGDFDDEEQISEHTSKILAAHHANSLNMIRGGSKGDKRRGKCSNKRGGLMGNNFTVALMVQLRDPLRNYEPVGTPMLALIQVERVFVPPKPKIYSTVSELRNTNKEDYNFKSAIKKGIDEEEKKEEGFEKEGIAQFKIAEVHVAGLKNDPEKKFWGTKSQQQSGSRWLVANGMGKGNKLPFNKSKSVTKTITGQPGDTLWSISSRVKGKGGKW